MAWRSHSARPHPEQWKSAKRLQRFQPVVAVHKIVFMLNALSFSSCPDAMPLVDLEPLLAGSRPGDHRYHTACK